MHDHSDMVVHVLGNITQEACRDDADSAKRYAHVVHVLVRLGVRELTSVHNQLIRTRHVLDTRKLMEKWEKRPARDGDCLSDDLWGCDVELGHHCAANVVGCGRDEFGDEDVVVHAVSDGTTNDADGKGQSSDRRDEVVWADDGGC